MTRRGDTLELAVLGLLQESPMHGYELRKQLNAVLGWGRVLSYGSLYPALKKMLRSGWISEHVTPAETAASLLPALTPKAAKASAAKASATSRRQRIVYELTSEGADRFSELMADAGPTAWEDGDFDVRFAFFGRADREVRLRVLEGRRARLEERLARVQQQLAVSKREDSYSAELHRHGLESVRNEVRWLSDLIAAERGETPSSTQVGTPTTTREDN